VKSTREQVRAEARRGKAERRRQAVEWIAEGRSQAEVARLLGMAKRSIERWCADPAFRADVERLLRQRELAAYQSAKKKADRAPGVLPVPVHPDEARAQRAEMERAREEVLARQVERSAAARPLTDEAVLAWTCAQDSVCEADFLDKRDAERGRISPRALRRYRGESGGRRTPPQVRVISLSTNASDMYEQTSAGPDRARDAFLALDPHCYDR
jgi:hypothetical protein